MANDEDISNKQQLEEIKKILIQSTNQLNSSIKDIKENLEDHVLTSNTKIKKLEEENFALKEKIQKLESNLI